MMAENRVAGITKPYDTQIQDTFALGYGHGVMDTMNEHSVRTDPSDAAIRGHLLFHKLKVGVLKVFYSHGDVMMVDPED